MTRPVSSRDGRPFTGQHATATSRFGTPSRFQIRAASRHSHIIPNQIVRLLLDEADRTGAGDIPLVTIVDEDGDTALHVAVSWGQSHIVDLLHGRGGILTGKNFAGKTPLDLAAPGDELH